jgi:hypothetical protein
LENPAQSRDETLHDRPGSGRGLLAPQLIDQPLSGDDSPDLQCQDDHERPGPPVRQIDRLTAAQDFDWTEESDIEVSRLTLHALTVTPGHIRAPSEVLAPYPMMKSEMVEVH